MKKFLVVAALVLGVVVSQLVAVPQVSAQDYFVGTYPDGTKGYFMSETYEVLHKYKGIADYMKCYVKVMNGNHLEGYLNYYIDGRHGGWKYSTQKNPTPLSWRSTDSDPIANLVKKHCIKMSIYGYTVDNP